MSKTRMETLAENVRTLRRAMGITGSELSRDRGPGSLLRQLDRERVHGAAFRSWTRSKSSLAALRAQVEELTGSAPIVREATPYDTNPTYRAHIANLEAIDASDREMILVLVEKYAAALGRASAPAKSRRIVTSRSKEAETTDRKRPTDERKPPIGMP